jgi:Fe-S-cluster containining protein
VPCNGCTECCSSNQGLFLHPEQGDDVESYQHRVFTDPASGKPVFVLATETNGRCVYLGVSGCTIYDRRPLLCRSFDCRKHYLILPKQDRDNLVKLGVSSRAVFNAGRARLKSLSSGERKECLDNRDEFFS